MQTVLIHPSKQQYIHFNLLSILQQNKLIAVHMSLLDETKLYFKSNVWNEHKNPTMRKGIYNLHILFNVCPLHCRHTAGFGDRQDKTDPCSLLGLFLSIVNWGPGSCERGRREDIHVTPTVISCRWYGGGVKLSGPLNNIQFFNIIRDLTHSQSTLK